MHNKRTLQIARRREEILAAASQLFSHQGYRRTTFDEIAATAKCSVATVYKHFANKEALVVAILQPDMDEMAVRARQVINDPSDDPGRSMVRLLSSYRNLGGRNWSNRELLRLTVFPTIENEGPLKDLVIKCEAATEAQIYTLLAVHRKMGQLASNLPLRDAAAVVFALLNQHFGTYLTKPGLSFEQMFGRLSRRVLLVFKPWQP